MPTRHWHRYDQWADEISDKPGYTEILKQVAYESSENELSENGDTANDHFVPKDTVRHSVPQAIEQRRRFDCGHVSSSIGLWDWLQAPTGIHRFHGGAFNRGNAAMYNTARMVSWPAEPSVVVSCRYRMENSAFLLPELSTKESALHLGLKDQILLSRRTLNRVPTPRAARRSDTEVHEQQFKDPLEAVQCPKRLSESEIFHFLHELPISVVADAQIAVFDRHNQGLRSAFQPVTNGKIIRGRYIHGRHNGRWHKAPMMTGFNGNEGAFMSKSKPVSFIDLFPTPIYARRL
ncbi:hypothetical protein F4778DRAFT_786558 [Xylariomycetidae sp. FL2044]|nr:hypothetical protein F4778DRAFT_786558 [Xylariomycetidae sp. FL2044]